MLSKSSQKEPMNLKRERKWKYNYLKNKKILKIKKNVLFYLIKIVKDLRVQIRVKQFREICSSFYKIKWKKKRKEE